jgi:hypothetical protein
MVHLRKFHAEGLNEGPPLEKAEEKLLVMPLVAAGRRFSPELKAMGLNEGPVLEKAEEKLLLGEEPPPNRLPMTPLASWPALSAKPLIRPSLNEGLLWGLVGFAPYLAACASALDRPI